jgi:hypothetical protein
MYLFYFPFINSGLYDEVKQLLSFFLLLSKNKLSIEKIKDCQKKNDAIYLA